MLELQNTLFCHLHDYEYFKNIIVGLKSTHKSCFHPSEAAYVEAAVISSFSG